MSFIQYQSYDLATQQPLNVKGTLRMPDSEHFLDVVVGSMMFPPS